MPAGSGRVSAEPLRILVVANETVGGLALIDAVRRHAERAHEQMRPFHVTVVCPQNRPRHGYVVYDESVRAAAQNRLETTLAQLRRDRHRGNWGGHGPRPVRGRDGRDRRLSTPDEVDRLDPPGDPLRLAAPRPRRPRPRRRGRPGRARRRRPRRRSRPIGADARRREPDGRRRAADRAAAREGARTTAYLHRHLPAGRRRRRRRPVRASRRDARADARARGSRPSAR